MPNRHRLSQIRNLPLRPRLRSKPGNHSLHRPSRPPGPRPNPRNSRWSLNSRNRPNRSRSVQTSRNRLNQPPRLLSKPGSRSRHRPSRLPGPRPNPRNSRWSLNSRNRPNHSRNVRKPQSRLNRPPRLPLKPNSRSLHRLSPNQLPGPQPNPRNSRNPLNRSYVPIGRPGLLSRTARPNR
ncbi:hypothetical protein GCM10023187_48010 [Nibrella viscosa]|uniref:Uncharacterized protein n=1 Tax=Nibrella viscosa TaxID=1084524 RepID=A0ABP8KVA4_9BACT